MFCFVQDNYQKLQDAEPKPKRPRKKTKPSALTRPSRKGKKKKTKKKTVRPQKTVPPVAAKKIDAGKEKLTSLFNQILFSNYMFKLKNQVTKYVLITHP